MNEWILELSLNGEVLRMKAFDQNSKALTNVLVHCAIFKRKMSKMYRSMYKPNCIYSKQAGMN